MVSPRIESMLRKNAKIELIKRVPLFERLSKRELEEIASLADELDLPAGRKLTKEGAVGHEFVVLADGSADVTTDGRSTASPPVTSWASSRS
jgi:hypothetical protein